MHVCSYSPDIKHMVCTNAVLRNCWKDRVAVWRSCENVGDWSALAWIEVKFSLAESLLWAEHCASLVCLPDFMWTSKSLGKAGCLVNLLQIRKPRLGSQQFLEDYWLINGVFSLQFQRSFLSLLLFYNLEGKKISWTYICVFKIRGVRLDQYFSNLCSKKFWVSWS